MEDGKEENGSKILPPWAALCVVTRYIAVDREIVSSVLHKAQ